MPAMSERPAAPSKDLDREPFPARDSRRMLLTRRLRIDVRLRAFFVTALLVGTLLARYVLGLEVLDLPAVAVLATIIVVYDLAAWAFVRVQERRDHAPGQERVLLWIAHGAIGLDFLALTALVWLAGGVRSPFAAFYVLHVIVSAVLLSQRSAWILAGLAYGLFALLLAGEWSGLVAPGLRGDDAARLATGEALGLLAVYAVLFGLTTFVTLGLVGQLREVEARIRLANQELRRLSELRKGFLHIAVHNLKAPLGAVQLHLDNLRSGLAGEVTPKQEEWLERSLTRLDDLSTFLQELQTLSSLETGIIDAQFTRVDLGAVVERVVEDYRDVARSHSHTLSLFVERPLPLVVGHERLLGEALVNYLTNAIKYTPDGGQIQVRARARDDRLRVEVSDSGVGIPAEEQPRLFREFVRLSTEGTPVEGAGGSGLGLSIVQRIAQAHGGRVGVESAPGRGSTFFLELPTLRA
jgi:signal transduction histidine kinase